MERKKVTFEDINNAFKSEVLTIFTFVTYPISELTTCKIIFEFSGSFIYIIAPSLNITSSLVCATGNKTVK